MFRRVVLSSIVLGFLLVAAVLLSSRSVQALTPTVSLTPSRTATTGCGSVIVVTSTPSPTLSPTPRVATATTTPSCGPIYVTATPGTVAAGPDLMVGSITYGGSSPTCANAPMNNVIVVNNGNAAAGTFVVSYNAGGVPAPTQTVTGLGAGQSVTLRFPSAGGAGMSVTAVADSTNVIAETNEGNNSSSAVLPIPTQAATCTPAPVTATVTPTATIGTPKADLSYPYTAYWVWDPKAYDSVAGCYNSVPVLVWRVDVKNTGGADAGSFTVSQNYDRQQVISGLPVGATASVYFPFPGGPGATAVPGQPTLAPNTSNFIADYNNTVDESNETNNRTLGYIPTFTATPAGGPTRVFCKATPGTPTATPTVTKTATLTPIMPTPTRTPTAFALACNPVNATITAPFVQDGVGTFCWQSANLGTYINSWNLTSLTINGLSIANAYVPAASYPAKVGGYWYVSYSSAVAWGHFEAK